MIKRLLVLFIFSAGTVAWAQNAGASGVKSTTVPFVLDHNRIVIEADISLPGGESQRISAWVDNGNPDFYMSRRVTTLLKLEVRCDERECQVPPPKEISIGGMTISLDKVKEAKIPLKSPAAAAILAPGMSAEMNVPSTILRNYDVLVDFPAHKLTLGQPGSLKFNGVNTKVTVNGANGLIEIPSEIEKKKKTTLGLDLGASISLLTPELFERLASAHPDWPHMTGAVGPANMWGLDDETKWKVMRADRLQYGPLFLTAVAVAEFPKDEAASFEKRAGLPTSGLIASEALLNYRVGLDYAHAVVYFDVGRLFTFPDFDVIGLTLRPEDDGRFTILAIADLDGKPSVLTGAEGIQPGDRLVAVDNITTAGSTMGQVWHMLGGDPGKQRMLTIEREGKQHSVLATVQHFLGETDAAEDSKKKSKKR